MLDDTPGALLGVDFGGAKIGIARTDPSRTLTTPLVVLAAKGWKTDVPAILDRAGEDQFVLLWIPVGDDTTPPDVAGWTARDDRTESWLGVDFHLTRYDRQASNVRS